MSFRNKYLQPLWWQEKETSGDFPPVLPASAGPPEMQECRGEPVGDSVVNGPRHIARAAQEAEKMPSAFSPLVASSLFSVLNVHPVVLGVL